MIESCDLCIRREECDVTPVLEEHVEDEGCELFICRIQVSDEATEAGEAVQG